MRRVFVGLTTGEKEGGSNQEKTIKKPYFPRQKPRKAGWVW